jgi:DinB superfamily
MKKQIIDAFIHNHQEAADYIKALTDAEFLFSYENKWTAGQQLKHIYLTLLPFTKALASKEYLKDKFGVLDRETWNLESIMEKYLSSSRKAPEQYLPEAVTKDQKSGIIKDLNEVIMLIAQLLNQFSEDEFNSVCMPHPLLGKLSLSEMFSLMGYHPIHHLKQVKANLGKFSR